jgi:hypothetical protein
LDIQSEKEISDEKVRERPFVISNWLISTAFIC